MIAGGYRFGAPGAIIGFFIGYVIEEVLLGDIEFSNPSGKRNSNYTVEYSQFQINLMILISALIKSDGNITKEKIHFTKNFLFKQFGSVYGSQMMVTLKEFTEKNFRIDEIAGNMRYSTAERGKLYIFSFLNELTIQNGTAHPNSAALLRTIAVNMGISFEDFENIINKHRKQTFSGNFFNSFNELDDAYNTLGVEKSVTDEELKKKYRQLVLKYHPDKTELDEKSAARKFDAIKKAYEIIKKHRNIK